MPETDVSLDLIVEIGCLAHSFGVSSGQLEKDLERFANATKHEGAFQVTPSSITFVLWREGQKQQFIHVEKLPAPNFNLGKLTSLSEIIAKGINDEISIHECLQALQELKSSPDPWSETFVALGYILCGLGFAVMMSLGSEGILIAGLVSLAIYGLGRLTAVWPSLGPRFEIISGFCVGFIVVLAAAFVPGVNPTPTIVAGLVILLPGYGLTLGAGELAAGHISSGMQRLMSSTLTALKLFIGATIGILCVSLIATPGEVVSNEGLGAMANWIAVVALVLGLAFVFQVRPKELLWVLLIGLATYLGMTIGNQLGPWQGSFFGGFALGILATLTANSSNRPETVALVPGLMILVPGASAVLGIQEVVAEGASAGLAAEIQTLVNVCAILAGLVAARNLVSGSKH